MSKTVQAKGPKVPSGGRMNPVDAGSQKMKKVPAPKSMKFGEKSTRTPGPK